MSLSWRMQHLIYWGPLRKPIEWSLKTVLAPWAYIASVIYHDSFWYPTHQRIVHNLLNSEWGRLFNNWDEKAIPPEVLDAEGWDDVGSRPAELKHESMKLLGKSFKILGTCIKEAPEFNAKRRHRKK